MSGVPHPRIEWPSSKETNSLVLLTDNLLLTQKGRDDVTFLLSLCCSSWSSPDHDLQWNSVQTACWIHYHVDLAVSPCLCYNVCLKRQGIWEALRLMCIFFSKSSELFLMPYDDSGATLVLFLGLVVKTIVRGINWESIPAGQPSWLASDITFVEASETFWVISMFLIETRKVPCGQGGNV